jgi:hypothetical protein
MSQSDIVQWFKDNLPKDFDLQEEIVKRIGAVLQHMRVDPNQQIQKNILLGVANSPEDPSRLTIIADGYGIIFLGVMAKAILDSLSGEFQALLSSPIGNEVIEKKVKEVVSQHISSGMKKCPHCQTEIRLSAQFCDQCGRKLES